MEGSARGPPGRDSGPGGDSYPPARAAVPSSGQKNAAGDPWQGTDRNAPTAKPAGASCGNYTMDRIVSPQDGSVRQRCFLRIKRGRPSSGPPVNRRHGSRVGPLRGNGPTRDEGLEPNAPPSLLADNEAWRVSDSATGQRRASAACGPLRRPCDPTAVSPAMSGAMSARRNPGAAVYRGRGTATTSGDPSARAATPGVERTWPPRGSKQRGPYGHSTRPWALRSPS